MHKRYLESTWSAQHPLAQSGTADSYSSLHPTTRSSRSARPSTALTGALHRNIWTRRLTLAAWSAAILLLIHRLIAVGFPVRSTTNDFAPVYRSLRAFLSRHPLYYQDYASITPHYLYNPGATVVLSPLGLIPNENVARFIFIALNLAAIVAALALLCRLVGRPLRGPVWPVSIAIAMSTEAIYNTVAFGNINGILLFALAGFLWTFVRARRDSLPRFEWIAGCILGAAMLIKPQFAPLLALPLVTLQWRPFIPAIGIPVILNLVAWPFVDAQNFVTKLLPYLSATRNYANSSLPGLTTYFGFSGWPSYSLWGLFACVAIVGFVFLLRRRNSDPLLWTLTTASFILLAVALLSALGQQYYSQWLFPLLFTAFLPRSAMDSVGAWVGAVLCLIPASDNWITAIAPQWSSWFGTFSVTLGWALLLCSTTGAALGWAAAERRQPPVVESPA